MNGSFGRKTVAGCALTLALLFVLGVLLYRGAANQFAAVGLAAGLAVWVSILLTRGNQRRHLEEEGLRKTVEQLELRASERTAELTQALERHKRAEQEIKKLNQELEKRVTE